MKIYRLENSVLAVEVDLDTGVITQIIDRVNDSKHLLARKPELEIKKPGMGVYVLEPFFCPEPSQSIIGDGYFMFRCSSGGVDLLWRIELSDSSIRYSVETHNKSDGEYINRFRIMIYSACGRGASGEIKALRAPPIAVDITWTMGLKAVERHSHRL
jgi:hypothetical protein